MISFGPNYCLPLQEIFIVMAIGMCIGIHSLLNFNVAIVGLIHARNYSNIILLEN